MPRSARTHDVVLFGATSFVGQILTQYMVRRHGSDGDVSWAIAGRNGEKLAEVAANTGAAVDRIVVDADDAAGLAEMCAHTNCVISTVGPYALYGSKLVAAVAEAGIDYVDLTGEPHWMQRMIDRYQDRAVETGARIVHSCGFDSVPSDMGVWFVQREAQERFGEPCSSISMAVKAAKGGASGGTIASMMNMMEEASADPSLREILANPYALAETGDRSGVDQPNVTLPVYDDGHESWLAPFVMAATNTRVVFRTHSLLGHPWGDDFTYGEAMMTGDGWSGRAKAMATSAALASAMGAVAFGPIRSVMGKVLPEPGEGPSPEKQEAGFFDIRFHGTTASGDELTATVTGDRDPGYASTAKMLAEAATTLADSDAAGGFWTPATALGDAYIDALVEHSGLTFDIT
ncbi:saccharopine dehydrogenase family protein [Ilumatobacter nonamiensis]|uniref:saccharopine dehydrogenase family protein n=1 Tax=Ilumatobacter nonamiensis TaxID=467093 RepID=UPI00034542DC|nr:saccharopine dehydrogenase NADP-binding domain-containing protein [Ilumatobacter nonamiensis]